MQQEPVFIALDFPDAFAVRKFLKQFDSLTDKPALKVGMELFYAEGPTFVNELRQQGYTIFLDLKLYDIPHTVGRAVASISKLDIQYLTIHASGGARMMAAAVANKPGSMKLLAVTQLTSFSESEMQATQLTQASLVDTVTHLAAMAFQVGVDGTISSPEEAKAIQAVTSQSFVRITPGIRLLGDDNGDQRRVTTPQKARHHGATGLVVGRSITQAVSALEAYQRVLQEWCKD